MTSPPISGTAGASVAAAQAVMRQLPPLPRVQPVAPLPPPRAMPIVIKEDPSRFSAAHQRAWATFLPAVQAPLAADLSGFKSLASAIPADALGSAHEFLRKARRVGMKTVPFSDEDIRRAVESRGGFNVVNQKGSRGLWKRIAREDLRWCMHATTKPCSCGQNLKNRFLQQLADPSGGQYRVEVVALDEGSSDEEDLDMDDALSDEDDDVIVADPCGEVSPERPGRAKPPHPVQPPSGEGQQPSLQTVRVWQTRLPPQATLQSLPVNSRMAGLEMCVGSFRYVVPQSDVIEAATAADSETRAAASLRLLQNAHSEAPPRMFEIKILYGRQKLEYTFLLNGLSHKMAIPFGTVTALSVNPSTHVLSLTLGEQPEFWQEVPSNHKNGKRYVRCEDFTQGQAFYYRIHYIRFADNEMLRHLAVLRGFDPSFADLPVVDHAADPRFPILPFLCNRDRERLALVHCVDCGESYCGECNDAIHRLPNRQNHFQRPITRHVAKKPKSVSLDRCRCGTSGALRGTSPSFSCTGKRCPCYAEGRMCKGCGCRNCKNPFQASSLAEAGEGKETEAAEPSTPTASSLGSSVAASLPPVRQLMSPPTTAPQSPPPVHFAMDRTLPPPFQTGGAHLPSPAFHLGAPPGGVLHSPIPPGYTSPLSTSPFVTSSFRPPFDVRRSAMQPVTYMYDATYAGHLPGNYAVYIVPHPPPPHMHMPPIHHLPQPSRPMQQPPVQPPILQRPAVSQIDTHLQRQQAMQSVISAKPIASAAGRPGRS